MQPRGRETALRNLLRSRLDFGRKRGCRAPHFVRQLTKLDFPHFNRKNNYMMRRPSVAFADYEIKDKRSSVMSSLLLLSAIAEGVASFVLPIIDAFGPPKYVEHKFYFEVFQLIQFTMSIAAMAYLQALMIYYNRKMQRRERLRQRLVQGLKNNTDNHIDEEDEEDDEDEENGSNESPAAIPTSPPDGMSPSIQTEDSTEEVSHESNPTSTPEHGSASFVNNLAPIHEQMPKSDSHLSNSRNSVHCGTGYTLLPAKTVILQPSGSSDAQFLRRPKPGMPGAKSLAERSVAHIGRMFGDTFGIISEKNPPYTQNSEGINLYLRLGTVVFGFGVMIMDGFRVADQFRAVNSERTCHSILWIPLNVIHAIYIFWQTYFLFKYHRVTFNVQKFIIRFILSHMAVVNLGQWLSTVVEEVVSSEEKSEHLTNTMRSLAEAVVAKQSLTSDLGVPAHTTLKETGQEPITGTAAFF
uniref:Otopetrin n=1 Tax=Echinococcus canadensis TaxID=519352 RepID=A0A915ESP6_9CEST